mgnify:CR=1 FL=1
MFGLYVDGGRVSYIRNRNSFILSLSIINTKYGFDILFSSLCPWHENSVYIQFDLFILITNSFIFVSTLVQLISIHKKINNVVKRIKKSEIPSIPKLKFKFKKGDIRTLIYDDYSFINTILELNSEDVRSRFELVTPIKVNLTIDGISGITCGETFRIDGIPEQYNRLGQFQITNTKHIVNTEQGWTTEIEEGIIQKVNRVTITALDSIGNIWKVNKEDIINK